MQIPHHYKGREQSYIKHQFLTRYLQAAAFKTLQGRSPTFNFVDAFAGPWNTTDKNHSDTSFDRAIRILEDVTQELRKKGKNGLKTRFCFCERRPEAVSALKDYAKSNDTLDVHIFEGEFEDNLKNIQIICENGFTFTFIDPTGWNIRSEPIFAFLKNLRGEFLLNFMSDHVNRHATYPQVAKSFGRFLAEPDWENEFAKLPESLSNEQRVLHLLNRRIKSAGAARYLPDMPILVPGKNRIKMRLILGTHSAAGLEVFRDVQKKVEFEAFEIRGIIDDQRRGTSNLFPYTDDAALQQEYEGIGSAKHRFDAECKLLEILDRTRFCKFGELKSALLESIPIRLTQLKQLLKDMKNRGVVDYDLAKRKQVPDDDTIIHRCQRADPSTLD